MTHLHSLRAAAPLAALALALAACGGDGASPTSAGEDKALAGALKFAKCMRGEGIDFPDPQPGSGGMIRIGPGPGGKGPDPSSPKVAAAEKACGKHLEQGGGPADDPATRAKLQDAFVKYAGCMRRNGVDLPDPAAGGGGLVIRPGDTGAPDPQSPQYKAADAKCHHHLAAADEALEDEPR